MLVASSCSTTVGAGHGPTTSSLPDFGGAASTAPPTTAAHAVTSAQLTALLPTADEIGVGYVEVPDDGSTSQSDKDWDAAVKDACPEYYKLTTKSSQLFTVAYSTAGSQGDIDVGRLFEDPISRRVAVELGDGSDFLMTDSQLEKLIEAINECKTITVPDPAVSGQIDMTLDATPDHHYGDEGLVMTMNMTVSGGKLAGQVSMVGHVRMFQTHAVYVSITTVDGIDPLTGQVVPVDYNLESRLAQRIQSDIGRLQGN